MSIDELVHSKHIERPKDWNEPVRAQDTLLKLPRLRPGMVQLTTQGKEEPIQRLQKAISAAVEKLVLVQQSLQSDLLKPEHGSCPTSWARISFTSCKKQGRRENRGSARSPSQRQLTAMLSEMKKRFEEYLEELIKGHEPGKVRIVLE